MKTTSKILLATCATAICAAFFLPAVIFSKTEKTENSTNPAALVLNPSASNDTISLPIFSNIEISDIAYPITIESETTPCVDIEEVDNLKIPRLILDNSWNGNASFEVADSTLHISLSMESVMADRDTNTKIRIPENNSVIATIQLPSKTLKSIQSYTIPMHLHNLHDASLKVFRNTPFIADSCTFRTIGSLSDE